MFWTCIRWGGTIAVILLVLAAGFFAIPSGPATTDIPAQPAEGTQQQPAKNFNL